MTKKSNAAISSDAVQKATGKTWDAWIKILDNAGGKMMSHKELVAVLGDEHGVAPWWRQMVAVGYEQARGLRVKHQTASGFSVSRSKTLPVPIEQLFGAWKDKRQRKRWLADDGFKIRTATENRSLRITWIDGGTSVEVMFYEKGKAKSQVTVQHSKLKNEKEAARLKEYWGEQLDKLAEFVA
jgi:uncharacterized protein YndB with AHSA1/START domain